MIFNDHKYHFGGDASLDMHLDETAEGVSETKKDNAVLYDDEMN